MKETILMAALLIIFGNCEQKPNIKFQSLIPQTLLQANGTPPSSCKMILDSQYYYPFSYFYEYILIFLCSTKELYTEISPPYTRLLHLTILNSSQNPISLGFYLNLSDSIGNKISLYNAKLFGGLKSLGFNMSLYLNYCTTNVDNYDLGLEFLKIIGFNPDGSIVMPEVSFNFPTTSNLNFYVIEGVLGNSTDDNYFYFMISKHQTTPENNEWEVIKFKNNNPTDYSSCTKFPLNYDKRFHKTSSSNHKLFLHGPGLAIYFAIPNILQQTSPLNYISLQYENFSDPNIVQNFDQYYDSDSSIFIPKFIISPYPQSNSNGASNSFVTTISTECNWIDPSCLNTYSILINSNQTFYQCRNDTYNVTHCNFITNIYKSKLNFDTSQVNLTIDDVSFAGVYVIIT